MANKSHSQVKNLKELKVQRWLRNWLLTLKLALTLNSPCVSFVPSPEATEQAHDTVLPGPLQ